MVEIIFVQFMSNHSIFLIHKQECQTDTKYARQNADHQSCVTMKIIRLGEQIPLIQFLDKQHIRQV